MTANHAVPGMNNGERVIPNYENISDFSSGVVNLPQSDKLFINDDNVDNNGLAYRLPTNFVHPAMLMNGRAAFDNGAYGCPSEFGGYTAERFPSSGFHSLEDQSPSTAGDPVGHINEVMMFGNTQFQNDVRYAFAGKQYSERDKGNKHRYPHSIDRQANIGNFEAVAHPANYDQGVNLPLAHVAFERRERAELERERIIIDRENMEVLALKSRGVLPNGQAMNSSFDFGDFLRNPDKYASNSVAKYRDGNDTQIGHHRNAGVMGERHGGEESSSSNDSMLRQVRYHTISKSHAISASPARPSFKPNILRHSDIPASNYVGSMRRQRLPVDHLSVHSNGTGTSQDSISGAPNHSRTPSGTKGNLVSPEFVQAVSKGLPSLPLKSTLKMLENGVRFKAFADSDKASWLSSISPGSGEPKLHLDRGFVRIYDPNSSKNGQASVVVPLSTSTPAQQICTRLSCPVNSLHVQYNGDIIRRLEPYDRPLAIQNDYLRAIGVTSVRRLQQMGDLLDLGFLVKFFAGRPFLDDGFGQHSLSAHCHVRRGRIFQQWIRKLCILNGTRLLIYPDVTRTGDPEIIPLSRSKVEELHIRGRGRTIKVTTSMPRRPVQTVFLSFDSIMDLNAWLARCVKAAAKVPPISDLSNLQLECLPEQVFCIGSERLLTQLNLRHNVLKSRPPSEDSHVIGWIEDLPRLQSLRTLNLADNDLRHFPASLLQLPALTELNLASNRMTELPGEVGKLRNLQTLNISNNHLCQLPSEILELQSLTTFDISFNQFEGVPGVLVRLPMLEVWNLNGNWIQRIGSDDALRSMGHVKRMELRFNDLNVNPDDAIPLGVLPNLTHLDIRDNANTTSLDLRSLVSLQVLKCQKNAITHIQLHGNSLQALHLENNRIRTLIVTPVPLNLKHLDVSNNNLSKLPEWVTELPRIEKIRACSNNLTMLPNKIFTNVCSLKYLYLNHNEIRALPTSVDNCFLECLDLHHNKISHLPTNLLASTHKLRLLNLAQNFLTTIPPLNSFSDLNKVQHLVLAANRLTDSVLGVIEGYRRLRVLDLSYNRLRNLNNGSIEKMTCLEEINLSGNRLHCLAPALASLPNLSVLRCHTNELVNIPDFSEVQTLKVLDVGNNRLQLDSLQCFLSPQLKHLDLSCNPELQLNPKIFEEYKTERLVALIDMSQEVQKIVPRPESHCDSPLPWLVGFSESSGERNKLCISQIRQPAFDHEAGEALFGMIDGGLNNEIPISLQKQLPDIVGHEKRLTDTRSDIGKPEHLKYSFIVAHRSLQASGQRLGASCIVCHIQRRDIVSNTSGDGFQQSFSQDPHYVCHLANVGHTEAVLCRGGEPVPISKRFMATAGSRRAYGDGDASELAKSEYERVREAGGIFTEDGDINGITPCTRLLGCSFLFPSVIPDPHIDSILLDEPDEFLLIANRGLWEYMDHWEAVRRVRHISNPIHAAKHLQDMAQAYGATGNLSIIIIRFFFNSSIPAEPNGGNKESQDQRKKRRVNNFQAASILDVKNLIKSTDTISTMASVQSEPMGRKIKEKPNYYFDYKRKMKEQLGEAGSQSTIYSSGASQLTMTGGGRRSRYISETTTATQRSDSTSSTASSAGGSTVVDDDGTDDEERFGEDYRADSDGEDHCPTETPEMTISSQPPSTTPHHVSFVDYYGQHPSSSTESHPDDPHCVQHEQPTIGTSYGISVQDTSTTFQAMNESVQPRTSLSSDPTKEVGDGHNVNFAEVESSNSYINNNGEYERGHNYNDSSNSNNVNITNDLSINNQLENRSGNNAVGDKSNLTDDIISCLDGSNINTQHIIIPSSSHADFPAFQRGVLTTCLQMTAEPGKKVEAVSDNRNAAITDDWERQPRSTCVDRSYPERHVSTRDDRIVDNHVNLRISMRQQSEIATCCLVDKTVGGAPAGVLPITKTNTDGRRISQAGDYSRREINLIRKQSNESHSLHPNLELSQFPHPPEDMLRPSDDQAITNGHASGSSISDVKTCRFSISEQRLIEESLEPSVREVAQYRESSNCGQSLEQQCSNNTGSPVVHSNQFSRNLDCTIDSFNNDPTLVSNPHGLTERSIEGDSILRTNTPSFNATSGTIERKRVNRISGEFLKTILHNSGQGANDLKNGCGHDRAKGPSPPRKPSMNISPSLVSRVLKFTDDARNNAKVHVIGRNQVQIVRNPSHATEKPIFQRQVPGDFPTVVAYSNHVRSKSVSTNNRNVRFERTNEPEVTSRVIDVVEGTIDYAVPQNGATSSGIPNTYHVDYQPKAITSIKRNENTSFKKINPYIDVPRKFLPNKSAGHFSVIPPDVVDGSNFGDDVNNKNNNNSNNIVNNDGSPSSHSNDGNTSNGSKEDVPSKHDKIRGKMVIEELNNVFNRVQAAATTNHLTKPVANYLTHATGHATQLQGVSELANKPVPPLDKLGRPAGKINPDELDIIRPSYVAQAEKKVKHQKTMNRVSYPMHGTNSNYLENQSGTLGRTSSRTGSGAPGRTMSPNIQILGNDGKEASRPPSGNSNTPPPLPNTSPPFTPRIEAVIPDQTMSLSSYNTHNHVTTEQHTGHKYLRHHSGRHPPHEVGEHSYQKHRRHHSAAGLDPAGDQKPQLHFDDAIRGTNCNQTDEGSRENNRNSSKSKHANGHPEHPHNLQQKDYNHQHNNKVNHNGEEQHKPHSHRHHHHHQQHHLQQQPKHQPEQRQQHQTHQHQQHQSQLQQYQDQDCQQRTISPPNGERNLQHVPRSPRQPSNHQVTAPNQHSRDTKSQPNTGDPRTGKTRLSQNSFRVATELPVQPAPDQSMGNNYSTRIPATMITKRYSNRANHRVNAFGNQSPDTKQYNN